MRMMRLLALVLWVVLAAVAAPAQVWVSPILQSGQRVWAAESYGAAPNDTGGDAGAIQGALNAAAAAGGGIVTISQPGTYWLDTPTAAPNTTTTSSHPPPDSAATAARNQAPRSASTFGMPNRVPAPAASKTPAAAGAGCDMGSFNLSIMRSQRICCCHHPMGVGFKTG